MNTNGSRLVVACFLIIGCFFVSSCETTGGTNGVPGTANSELLGLKLSAFIQGTSSSSGFAGIITRASRYHEVAPMKPDPKPVPKQYTVQIIEGMELERQGKYAEAESIYRQVIKDLPNTPAPFARLAFTLQAMGYGHEACEIFRTFQSLGGRYRTQFVPEEINALVAVDPPKDVETMLQSTQNSYGLISSEGGKYILHLQNISDQVMISSKEYCFGVRSIVRFDKKDWVLFLSRSYRNGGVSVTSSSLIFMDGTERLEDGNQISVFRLGAWKVAQ